MEGRASSPLKQIFGAALDVSDEDLPAFLNSACGGDAALEAEILSLLQSHRRPVHFFDPTVTPSSEDLADKSDDTNLDRFTWMLLDEQPGSIIDRYKLLEVIGEGGHGVVFRAEQEQPIHRQVALKVIRKGMETDAVRSRFEAERQTLALMDHPNIAKLFDAGTTEQGRPYFVMELVAGTPLTQFCDDRRLTIRQRVELFITICRAIHHAHQKGVIHRDLKPSNILVAEADGIISPKVIDFGIARVTTESLPTAEDMQIIGTPRYMSPEQVAAQSVVVDIRSDVYSLGAMLCELLAGVTAIEWNDRTIHTIQDLRELFASEPTGRPSELLAKVADLQSRSEDFTSISRNRHIDPSSLLKSLREDLDWIVLKAVHRDRASRYDSVAALADDLQRYLERRPVLAAPTSVSYLFRRFCVRNKAAVIVSLAIVASLVVSLAVVIAALLRAHTAEAVKVRAEAAAISSLRDSYLQQAQAGQRSRWQGQRLQSLNAIALAARISPSLELRNQAIACMSLVDVKPVDRWERSEIQYANIIFAKQADLYAMHDRHGTIQVFRRSDRHPICVIPGEGFPIDYFLLFSQDGKYLAARFARGSNRLRVWELSTQRVVFQSESTLPMDFSHRCDSFATGTPSGTIEIHALPAGKIVKSIDTGGPIERLCYWPEDDQITVAAPGGLLRIVSLDSASPIRAIQTTLTDIMAMAWNPQGQNIVVAGFQSMNEIEGYNAQTGKLQARMKGHIATPNDLAFSDDGRVLLSGGWDGRVIVWEPSSGVELLSLPGFGGSLQWFTSSNQFSFETARDEQIWELVTSKECRSFNTALEDGTLWSGDISPDNTLVASATAIGVRIWSLSSGKPFCFLAVPAPRSVLFSADGKQLFASTVAGVKRWEIADIAGRQDPLPDPVDEKSTSAMAVSRDGHTMIFGTPDGALRVGDSGNLSESKPVGRHSSAPRYVAISPDGTWAASCVRRERTFKVWNPTQQTLATEIPLTPSLEETGAVAFSSDGKTLVVSDHAAYRWYRVGDWKLINQLDRIETMNPGLIAFSPDGTLVALGGPSNSVVLADPATGRELATLDTPATPHGPAFIAFSRDSTKLIATGGGIASVIVWNLPLIRQELASMNLDWQETR